MVFSAATKPKTAPRFTAPSYARRRPRPFTKISFSSSGSATRRRSRASSARSSLLTGPPRCGPLTRERADPVPQRLVVDVEFSSGGSAALASSPVGRLRGQLYLGARRPTTLPLPSSAHTAALPWAPILVEAPEVRVEHLIAGVLGELDLQMALLQAGGPGAGLDDPTR